jgi:hypothetical protein
MSSANVETVVVHIDDVPEELLQPPVSIPTLTTDDDKPCFNDECVICFDNIKTIKEEGHKVVSFQCQHQICHTCVVEYLKNQVKMGLDITCPVCRFMLLKADSTSYQQHRINFYNNNIISQDSDENVEQRRRQMQNHIAIQMQFYREQAQVNRRRSLYRHRALKRLILCIPCLVMVVLVFTLIGLYNSGALK